MDEPGLIVGTVIPAKAKHRHPGLDPGSILLFCLPIGRKKKMDPGFRWDDGAFVQVIQLSNPSAFA